MQRHVGPPQQLGVTTGRTQTLLGVTCSQQATMGLMLMQLMGFQGPMGRMSPTGLTELMGPMALLRLMLEPLMGFHLMWQLRIMHHPLMWWPVGQTSSQPVLSAVAISIDTSLPWQ